LWYSWLSNHIGINALAFGGELGNVPEWASTLELFACIIVGYLLGSINPSIIVSKKLYGKDIRESGSGNAGLTNMLRVYGKKAALCTLAGDMLKTALSVALGACIYGVKNWTVVDRSMEGAYLAALFCVLGHIAPIYYKFRGGKGVLAAATAILLLDPIVFLMLLGVFALVLILTRFVSMSSITAAFFYPALTYITHSYIMEVPPAMVTMLFSIICAVMVIYMHRENIRRIANGKENKLSFGGKKKETEEDDEEEE